MKLIFEILWAVVCASSGFLRGAPDYESPLETQLMMGSVIKVDETRGYWCHAESMDPPYQGWINALQISFKTEDEISEWIEAPKYICTADRSYVYDGASPDAPRICDIVMGELVRRAPGKSCSRVKVILPDGRQGWMDEGAVEDFLSWVRGRKPSPDALEMQAREFLGTTYMWGGNCTKYFDCSGLVRLTYYMNGLLLPRNASQMVLLGEEIPCGDMSQWRKGDLLFFGTPAKGSRPMRVGHVAMYLGEGRIIHSSQVVRICSLLPEGEDYYEREVIAVRRMLAVAGQEGGPQFLKDCPWYFKQ